MKDAWRLLSRWVLGAGYAPDLVRTVAPTTSQLAAITDQMTEGCAHTVLGYAVSGSAHIDDLKTSTDIGVRAPAGTVVTADVAITGRVIASATADVDAQARLTFQVASSADIHYVGHDSDSRRSHSKLARTTVYTVVEQSGHWMLSNWQGHDTTSDS